VEFIDAAAALTHFCLQAISVELRALLQAGLFVDGNGIRCVLVTGGTGTGKTTGVGLLARSLGLNEFFCLARFQHAVFLVV
jgi:Tfp pilus assembly pilus retraction ATPase PilT